MIIDNLNSIVNNPDKFVFLEYPTRYPNWVAHLGTQRFQLNHIIKKILNILLIITIYISSKIYLQKSDLTYEYYINFVEAINQKPKVVSNMQRQMRIQNPVKYLRWSVLGR